jgi:hypothetical protein
MNLGVFGPKDDATVMYRGLGVLYNLRKHGVNVIKCETADYITLKQFDVVFVQRPHSEAHFQLCKEVVSMGIPLWLDYDDFLFQVPVSNPAYKIYMNDTCHKRMAEMIEIASAVTVSTMALKALLEISDTPVVCVPNIYDSTYHGEISEAKRTEWITWRGSKTHDEDLLSVYEPLCDFLSASTSNKIEFIGHIYWQLLDLFPKQVRCIGSMPWFQYMRYLKARAPRLHIVPLKDNVFNKCKSNVALIEARVAGADVLAPDWYEWRNADFKYKDANSFYSNLSNKQAPGGRHLLASDPRPTLVFDILNGTVKSDRVSEADKNRYF